MSTKQGRSLGLFILQLALGLYFIVTGICLFGVGVSISSEEIKALTAVFKSANIVNVIIGILLIVYGVMLFLKAIVKGLDFGKLDDIFKMIALILWIIVTVVALYSNMNDISNGANILHWLLILAKNAFIIGGMLTLKDGRL